MPSITYNGNALNFIALDGAVSPPGLMVEDVTRKGFDGVAWRQDANRGQPFQLVGVLDTDAPQEMANYLMLLQGQIVSLLDATESGWDACVLSVRIVQRVKIGSAVGGVSAANFAAFPAIGAGLSTHLMTVLFEMQIGVV